MPKAERPTQHTPEAARERVERMAHRYIARGPYCFNPDPTTVEYVLSGLARNLVHHGRAYCPCRDVTGDPERDRPNICPCPQHRADISRDGFCECGIFVSREYAAAHASDDTAQTTKEA